MRNDTANASNLHGSPSSATSQFQLEDQSLSLMTVSTAHDPLYSVRTTSNRSNNSNSEGSLSNVGANGSSPSIFITPTSTDGIDCNSNNNSDANSGDKPEAIPISF